MSVENTFDFSLPLQETNEIIETPNFPETLFKGKIIVIEGIDGAGKTVQTQLLSKTLTEKGYDVLLFDFPQYQNNFFGKIIGHYLTGQYGNPTDVNPFLSAVLYASDRMESRSVITEHLNKGGVVILNRYVESNLAYNASKLHSLITKTKLIEYIEKLEYDTNKIPKADVVIYLDVDTSVSQELLLQKAPREYITDSPTNEAPTTVETSINTSIDIPLIDLGEGVHEKPSIDMYEKDVSFQQMVRKEYLDLCKSRRDKWIQIACMINGKLETPERIQLKVFSMLCRKLLQQRHVSTDNNSMYLPHLIKKDIPLSVTPESNRDAKQSLVDRLRIQREEYSKRNTAFGRGNVTLRQQQQEEEAERSKKQRELLKTINMEKKEKEKTIAEERRRELARRVEDIKKRTTGEKTQPRANIPTESVPKPEIKCYILPREVIERVRKTDNLMESIFGSPEYVKEIYYFFLQKYGYPDLPPVFQTYFRALMQHYFEEDVVLYPEDEFIRNYLNKIIILDNEQWQDKLPLLYRQYKIVINQINPVSRRWFPEEIIIIASIFRQHIRFGDTEFIPEKLDNTRLSSIYVQPNPLRVKFQKIFQFLKTRSSIKPGLIQINL